MKTKNPKWKGIQEMSAPEKRVIKVKKNEIVDTDIEKHIKAWGKINRLDNLKREIYSTLLQENDKYSRYTKEQVYKYVSDYSDYSEWIWTNKINRMCPEPFAYHIKTGSFIADEMRGQVVGLWREKTKDGWSSLAVMTKWDWRYMDEDSLQTYKCGMAKAFGKDADEREYFIINTEQMECDLEYLSHPILDTLEGVMEDNESVPDEIDDYLCYQIELQAEIDADIARGK